MLRANLVLIVLVASVLAAGCATVDPRVDYEQVSRRVLEATGQPLSLDDARLVTSAVDARLAEGLTADEAVQICLLNNPKLQAILRKVAMARADVVQSGLFRNPSLGLAFKLPEGGGLTQFELSLAQNVADFWMIPARQHASDRELARVILDAAREAASLAWDTKTAYFNAIAAERALAIARENAEAVARILSITKTRQEAGAVGELDVSLARSQALKADIEVRTSELEAANARRTLATLLGLRQSIAELTLLDPLPQPQSGALDVERLLTIAAQSRLDRRAAEEAVFAAEAGVQAEYAKVFQDVEVGFDLESEARRALPGRKVLADTARASIANGGLTAPEIESRGQRKIAKSEQIAAILGPSVAMTLPIFDQNQAQIAKARYAHEEAVALLDALDRSIVQETRGAVDRLANTWSVAVTYDRELVPEARKALELSEAAYSAGRAPILNVIEAQRSLLEIRRGYVITLESAASAMVDLERATGRPSRDLLGESLPSTQPASQRAEGVNATEKSP